MFPLLNLELFFKPFLRIEAFAIKLKYGAIVLKYKCHEALTGVYASLAL